MILGKNIVRLFNSNDFIITLVIEPWATEYLLKPQQSIIVTAMMEQLSPLDIDYKKNYIIIDCWNVENIEISNVN